MSYYYNGSDVRQFDDALFAAWIANGNPKATGWSVISDPPGPGYTWNGSKWVAPPVYVPQQVTRFQAKATMLAQGLLAQAEGLVVNSSDPLVKMVWAEALTFDRNSPTLNALASQMGLTSEQVDEFFIAASQVSA